MDGVQLTSQPLHLRVVQPGAASAAQINSGSQVAFMKLTLPEDKVYEGEVITAELEVYLRDDVRNFGNFQFTATPAGGFTVGKMHEGQQRREQVGDHVYTVVPVFHRLDRHPDRHFEPWPASGQRDPGGLLVKPIKRSVLSPIRRRHTDTKFLRKFRRGAETSLARHRSRERKIAAAAHEQRPAQFQRCHWRIHGDCHRRADQCCRRRPHYRPH